VALLTEIAGAHGAVPAQVALQWLVSFNGETVVAIPGATSPAQAEDNAAALNFALTPGELGSIAEESRRISP
jgi:aryl-alcohol dehydrogenase-like predicted oxidoreductase